MFEQPTLDYREFPHFEVRKSFRNANGNKGSERLHRFDGAASISMAGHLTSDCDKRLLDSLGLFYRKEINDAVFDGARPWRQKRLLFASRRGVRRVRYHMSLVAAPDDRWIRL